MKTESTVLKAEKTNKLKKIQSLPQLHYKKKKKEEVKGKGKGKMDERESRTQKKK